MDSQAVNVFKIKLTDWHIIQLSHSFDTHVAEFAKKKTL